MHKRNFSLTNGSCLNDDNYSIIAFDVKAEGSEISVLLPEPEDLAKVTATSRWMVKRDTAKILDNGVSLKANMIDIVGPRDEQVSGCASTCGDSKLEW